MKSAQQTVAVLGLGAMGLPIALHLLEAGCTVHGCDVSRRQLSILMSAGGSGVVNPCELPTDCSVYFLVLPNPEITEEALFGDKGLVKGNLRSGDTVINLGTIGPEAVLGVARRLEEINVDVLDIPMGKSSAAASTGTLSLLASGDKEIFDALLPLLKNIATEIRYCGPLGMASTIKIINNLVSATIVDVVAQGLAFGAAVGVPIDKLIEFMSTTGADNWHLRNTFANRVTQRDFNPGASIDIVAKDMKIGLSLAANNHVSLATIALSYQRYLAAQAAGFGLEDWGALAKVAERDSGDNVEILHVGEISLVTPSP